MALALAGGAYFVDALRNARAYTNVTGVVVSPFDVMMHPEQFRLGTSEGRVSLEVLRRRIDELNRERR